MKVNAPAIRNASVTVQGGGKVLTPRPVSLPIAEEDWNNTPPAVQAMVLQLTRQYNPLIADLLRGEPATIFFLSNRDYWLRDAPSGLALARVIPWGVSQIEIRPIIALTAPRRAIPKTQGSPSQEVTPHTGLEPQHPSDAELTDFEVPHTGNLVFIGRPNLFGFREKVLFRIEAAPPIFLDQSNRISEQLRQKFVEEDISLSPETTISFEENSRWLITDKDNDKIYHIRRGAEGQLNVVESPFQDFLDQVGYPGRFSFYTSDRHDPGYRTIVDQQTGASYNIVRNEKGDLKDDHGFFFKKKIHLYTPRYVTIFCGTSTLGTWGTVEYATSPELWVNVPGLSTLEELPDSVELLIHVQPDSERPYHLNNSHLRLVAHSFNYPSRAKLRENQIRTVDELMSLYRERMKRDREIRLENTIFPPGSLSDPKSVEDQQIGVVIAKTARLVGETAGQIHEQIQHMCRIDSIESPKPVLILGEMGTGKEVVAGLIAYHWLKRVLQDQTTQAKIRIDSKPPAKWPTLWTPYYTQTNCAAIAEGLADSEVFGHEKGAFTGAADQRHFGVIQQAGCGVCFLDEFGDLSSQTQPKLLRTLANRQIQPVGYNQPFPIPIYAKIVAATNKDLIQAAENGEFRADLLSRFPHAHRMILKPLRERKEDLPPLMVYWLEMAFREHQVNKAQKGEQKEDQAPQPLRKVHIEESALQFFLGYHYPANIRSLFDLLDEITANAGTFDEMMRSDNLHDEITLDFDQIPAEYMTDEFHALKKKDDEEKSYLTFIPESSEPESSEPESSEESGFQEKLDHFKEELNQLCQRLDQVKKEDVQPIIEETSFKSVLKKFKSMTADEKRQLKEAFKAIASCAKMTNDEKWRLLTEEGSVWKDLTHGEIAFLFGCVEATVSRWRKRGGGDNRNRASQ